MELRELKLKTKLPWLEIKMRSLKYVYVIDGENPTIHLIYRNMPGGVLLFNYKGK